MELSAPYVLQRGAHLAASIPKHIAEVKRSIEHAGFAGADLDLIATLVVERAAKMHEMVETP